jgi:hypothetical protein
MPHAKIRAIGGDGLYNIEEVNIDTPLRQIFN